MDKELKLRFQKYFDAGVVSHENDRQKVLDFWVDALCKQQILDRIDVVCNLHTRPQADTSKDVHGICCEELQLITATGLRRKKEE